MTSATDPARRPARAGPGQGPPAVRPRLHVSADVGELTDEERKSALPDARNYLSQR
ncbi:hypothetical protein [Nonomuraea dietziae]|uniref:hypothetical protein n=1 Tax=Nonomuraea dietziae TaxID=65515 RepID=UPI0031D5EBEC